MESVRHIPNIVREFFQPLQHMANFILSFDRQKAESPVDTLQFQHEQGQALVHIIMQVLCNPPTFFFLGRENPTR